VIKVGEAAVGGVMAAPPGAPAMPASWSPYITVADADATAQRCTALGGKLLAGPMDIPNVGRFALLQDPQGAMFNVIAYGPMPG
jgi:predicted enzyme related to lactoylglutathione lyase